MNRLIPLSVALCALPLCANASPDGPDPKDVLTKAFAVYANAKSYQASWSYTLERGTTKAAAVMEVKSKGGKRVLVKLSPAPGTKTAPAAESIPELTVAVDGKTAWFQNATAGAYYRVALPKDAGVSPLLLIPRISATSDVTLSETKGADGQTVYSLEAPTTDGGTSRVDVDPATYHIRRIAHERTIGAVKETSTFQFDKETFDADLSDKVFDFKPARGAKEQPAPPDAAALFGA